MKLAPSPFTRQFSMGPILGLRSLPTTGPRAGLRRASRLACGQPRFGTDAVTPDARSAVVVSSVNRNAAIGRDHEPVWSSTPTRIGVGQGGDSPRIVTPTERFRPCIERSIPIGAGARPRPTRGPSPARAYRLPTIANWPGWGQKLTNGANGPAAFELATPGETVEEP